MGPNGLNFKTRSVQDLNFSRHLHLRKKRNETLAIIAIGESQEDSAGSVFRMWQGLL